MRRWKSVQSASKNSLLDLDGLRDVREDACGMELAAALLEMAVLCPEMAVV